MHRFKIVLSSIATLLVLGGAALFYSGSSVADDRGDQRRHKDTDVTWSPSVLNFSVKPGETVSLPVTFTARERIDDGTIVYASSSLKDIVKVSPTTFGPLRKGQTATITATVTLPILQGEGTITGFLQLYDDGKRWKGKRERIEKRLPFVVIVRWQHAEVASGIHVAFPPSLQLQAEAAGGAFLWDAGVPADAVSELPGISVRVLSNPTNLSFESYFDGSRGEGPNGATVSVVQSGPSSAYQWFDGGSFAGATVAVIPIAGAFIQVTDEGSAFQLDGTFQAILNGISVEGVTP